MPILRERVLQNTQQRTTNDLQEDGREARRVLRLHRPLAGKRKVITVPGLGIEVVIHGLGYIPRGWNIELGNNNSIRSTTRNRESITFANDAVTAATITVWIY